MFRQAALALLLNFSIAGASHAMVLYSNFDPTATAPVDYSTTAYADLSGSCSNVTCLWINGYSASFTFTASATGQAAKAYLPLLATFTYPGAERIYGLTITNGSGEIVARGGDYGRNIPIGQTRVYEFDLFGNTSAGQPVASGTLAANPLQLTAGEQYTAYFAQTYGSLSGTEWFKSDVVPEAGQASTVCYTNAWGVCAYWGGTNWVYPLGYANSVPMTDFLPALSLTDGGGFVVAAGSVSNAAVPEPGTMALLGLGVLGMGASRLRSRRWGA